MRPSVPVTDEHDADLSMPRESSVLRAALGAHVAARSSLFPDEENEGVPRVLVADADPATRERIASVLRLSGYEVDTAGDGTGAIERAARGGIDVVLLDTRMLRWNGVEACRTIRGLTSDFVPVLFVFAKTDPRSRIDALQGGADGYVCKPLEQTELLVAVASALRQRRAHVRARIVRERLDRLRSTDATTGVASFGELHRRLEEEFARAERSTEPLACAILDIDRLKGHNERGGRGLGDAVLRGVVDSVRASIRDSDFVARFGGDELFVLMPSTHFAGALAVASRIWRDVGGASFRGPPGAADGRATVSIGVALFPSRDVRTKEVLLQSVEHALFEAKRRGGNRVCVFQQDGFVYTPPSDGEPAPRPGLADASLLDASDTPSEPAPLPGQEMVGEGPGSLLLDASTRSGPGDEPATARSTRPRSET